MVQITMGFDVVHTHEKHPDGQKHLEANRDNFNCDAWDILLLLVELRRLNNPQCQQDKLTLSLSSRISELRKSSYKVNVSKEWFRDPNTGKRIYIEYFLKPEEAERIKSLIFQKLKFKKGNEHTQN